MQPDVASQPEGSVVSVQRSPTHTMAKGAAGCIRLLEGLGVEGDAHLGTTVQHRSRVRVDPTKPNLRQVHLIHAELHDELACCGIVLRAGEMGENVATRGIDLLGLPTGTVLRLGADAQVALTGLRNPCRQLNGIDPHLLGAVRYRDADGRIVRTAGVMAVVLHSGCVRPTDPVSVLLPPLP